MKKYLLNTLAVIVSLGMIIGASHAAESFPDLQSFYQSRLTSSVSSSATTLNVNTAPAVSTVFLVLESGTNNQEIAYMTSRSGTALTVVRGLGTSGSTLTNSGNGKPHAAGTRVEIADVHYYTKLIQESPVFTFRGATTTASIATTDEENLDIVFSTTTERWSVFNGTSWVQMGDNTEEIGGIKNFIDGLLGTASSTFTSTFTLTGPFSFSDGRASTFTEAVTFSPTNRPVFSSHPTFSADTELIDKKYADDLAIAGAPDASLIVKGLVEIPTKAEVAAGTKFGSTGAYLAIPAEYATSTSQVATTSVPVTLSTGRLDNSFIPLSAYIAMGNGSDGNVTISTPTTLTKDMYYNNLTVNSTLTTNGFLIFVKETLSGTGTITSGTANNGSNGSNGQSQEGVALGGAGGDGGAASITGRLRAVAGANGKAGEDSNVSKNGAAGVAGTSATSAFHLTNGVVGGLGGGGQTYTGSPGTSGSGGTAGVSTQGTAVTTTPTMSMLGIDMPLGGSLTSYTGTASGGSGGGGGGGNSGGGINAGGGGGGGSGASGIPILIAANTWAGTFTIQGIGGNGGNGGNGGDGAPGQTAGGGGGGGAGGNGPPVVVFYYVKTWTGVATLTSGTGGSGGSKGEGGGVVGTSGTNGTAGTLIEVSLNNFVHN